MSDPFARLHVESLAMYLANCSARLCDEALAAGMNSRLVAGVRAARDAFAEHVTETDAQMLFEQIKTEVHDGLAELDEFREKRRVDG